MADLWVTLESWLGTVATVIVVLSAVVLVTMLVPGRARK